MNWSDFKLNKDNKLNIILLLIYATITLITVFHHEVWRDEAQAWVLVRDTNFLEMIKLTRIEGHPPLWYLFILPFTRIFDGFNAIFSMQLLNWFLIILGVYLFIFKSPFNIFFKTVTLCGSGFLFWYPAIARNYCFIPLFLFLLAMLYPKQDKHPFLYILCLTILANSHIIMFGFCLALIIIFAINTWKKKTKQSIIATIFGVLFIVFLILYLWNTQNNNISTMETLNLKILKSSFEIFSIGLIGSSNLFTNLTCYLLLIFSGINFYKVDKKVFFIYALNLLFQIYVYFVIINIPIPQRIYSLILVIIFCTWLCYKKIYTQNSKNLAYILLIFISLLTVKNGISLTIQDWKTDYSDGKKIAKYIINNTSKNDIIISIDPFMTTSISAYLPKTRKLYDIHNKTFYTYTTFNKSKQKTASTEIDIKKLLNDEKHIYIISNAYLITYNERFVINRYDKNNIKNKIK